MAHNIPELYTDVLYALRHVDEPEETRNGPAKVLGEPAMFCVADPTQRVMFNPERMANPYFHMMETVWMFAGHQNVEWLQSFNSNIDMYADDGMINGAYGQRWRKHWPMDQILNVISCLKENPKSRQAVIAMWNPYWDLWPSAWKDRPCNTHIYFACRNEGQLEMTVCNRSNDAVWGLTGANAVHMTYLHELVALACGMTPVNYYVMTNNLHIYEQHWHLMDNPQPYDQYTEEDVNPFPVLHAGETYELLVAECDRFITDYDFIPSCKWLKYVALPMREAYYLRQAGGDENRFLEQIHASDWRRACFLWQEWHNVPVPTPAPTEEE